MDGKLELYLVVVAFLMLLLIVITMIMMMAHATARRIRHHAEVTELKQQHDREVMQAEREAVNHTLRDIGRELHDNVGQLLTVVQMGMNNVMRERPDLRLEATRDALDQGVEEVRRLGHSLNSDMWRLRSLADAISAETDRLQRVGRIHACVEVNGPLPELPPDSSTVLFRVFQEVVNNALKHSGANAINIVLDGRGDPLLTVTDNGAGFDAERTAGNGGLVNIRKRCALIGYTASCTSAPGQGCTWRIQQLNEHGA